MVAAAPASVFAAEILRCGAVAGEAPNASVAPPASVGLERGFTVPAGVRAGGWTFSAGEALNMIVLPAPSSPREAMVDPPGPTPALPGAALCGG
jgi:hypothetical protein